MGKQWSQRDGLLAGALSAALALAVTLSLALATGAPSLPELVSDRLLELTPGPLFSLLIDRLQTAAKPLFYLGILFALLVIGALAGGWFARRAAARGSSLLRGALALALALWLVEELLVLPLFGAGVFGQAPRFSGLSGPLVRLAGLGTYGLVLAVLLAFFRPVGPLVPSRRMVLRWGVVGVLGLVGGGALLRALGGVSEIGAISRVTRRGGNRLPDPITPVGQFYTVSKNFIDPVVDRASWKLEVSGLVRRPLTLRLDDLRQFPLHEQLTTLICISNEVGGDLISNGQWRGVRLGELLSRAGVEAGAVDVVFTCADDYTDSIPLAKAMEPTTLLALEMNGQPLTDKHGAPLRAVVPDIYGMKNAKWIRKVEVVGYDYQGFWQRQGWSDSAIIQTTSRIDYPLSGSKVARGEVEFGGIAFAGARGIRAVELSFDEGKSWQPAALLEEIAPLSWRFWTLRWRLDQPGPLQVLVRATDGTGELQSAQRTDPFPNGATGYHRVFLTVV
jgi:hypothetical protein